MPARPKLLIAATVGLLVVGERPPDRFQKTHSLTHFNGSIARSRKSSSTENPLYARAADALEAGDTATAKEIYQRLLDENPRQAVGYSTLATVYSFEDNPAKAAELYRQALDRDPDHPPALHGLAVIAFNEGRYADAADLERRALAVKRNNPWAEAGYHSTLAKCLVQLHDPERALAHLELALATDPERAVSLKLHERIAGLRAQLGR